MNSYSLSLFIVFDLDDTLADTAHRQHLLDASYETEEERWNTFFDPCDADEPVKELIELFTLISHYVRKVQIWTGRSERVREKTEKWLAKHAPNAANIPIRMRPEGDRRPDTELKAKWIEEVGTPDIVFDDRNKMVEFWRAQGIICCQVKESTF